MAKKEGSTKKAKPRSAKADIEHQLLEADARLDAIEAKQTAHEELRSISEKKFDHINEEIGELKELFKIIEEDKKDLEVEIQTTIKKVNETSPETLKKNYQELVGIVDKLDGKFSLLSKQYDKFQSTFKSFDHKLKVFKGEEELLKLQQRIKQDLLATEKVSHTAHKHASKIENHYIKINERVNDAVGAVDEIKELRKELEDMKAEMQQVLDVSHEGADGRVAQLEHTVDDLSKVMIQTFEKLQGKTQEHEAALSTVHNTASRKHNTDVDKLKKEVASLKKHVSADAKKLFLKSDANTLKQEFEQRIEALSEQLAQQHSSVKAISHTSSADELKQHVIEMQKTQAALQIEVQQVHDQNSSKDLYEYLHHVNDRLEQLDTVVDQMQEGYSQELDSRISALENKHQQPIVSEEEFKHMKEWVLYLIEHYQKKQ